MTAHHSRKQQICAAMDSTGRPFAEISRLADDLDRVLSDHPPLSRFGMGLSRTLVATPTLARALLAVRLPENLCASPKAIY
jgi:hypothetical protein